MTHLAPQELVNFLKRKPEWQLNAINTRAQLFPVVDLDGSPWPAETVRAAINQAMEEKA